MAATCPLLRASIGQHIRHSFDHIRKVLEAGDDSAALGATIHYDERARNTDVERFIVSAEQELEHINDKLVNLGDLTLPVTAQFMMAASPPGIPPPPALSLASTLARELAFVAHHSIHHNAMILAIVKNQDLYLNQRSGLLEHLLELAPDFGSAPSTTAYRQEQTQKGK